MGTNIDPQDENVTLEKIMKLGFDAHSETIIDISVAAAKELFIETMLYDIQVAWNSIYMTLIPYKSRGHNTIKYDFMFINYSYKSRGHNSMKHDFYVCVIFTRSEVTSLQSMILYS